MASSAVSAAGPPTAVTAHNNSETSEKISMKTSHPFQALLYLNTGIQIISPTLLPIPWYSSALEAAFLWFLSQATWEFSATRVRTTSPGGQFSIITTVSTQQPDKPTYWSNFTTLQTLLQAHAFPASLVFPWETGSGISKANGKGEPFTTMNMDNLATSGTLGQIAYGLTDTCIDFFIRGATRFSSQLSLNSWQVQANVGLPKPHLDAFLDPNIPSYSPSDTLARFPWHS